jgi:hypothetical protein
VAIVALAAGKDAFSDYSHIYSPHKFTQPQLFACLVLKEFGQNKGVRFPFRVFWPPRIAKGLLQL